MIISSSILCDNVSLASDLDGGKIVISDRFKAPTHFFYIVTIEQDGMTNSFHAHTLNPNGFSCHIFGHCHNWSISNGFLFNGSHGVTHVWILKVNFIWMFFQLSFASILCSRRVADYLAIKFPLLY